MSLDVGTAREFIRSLLSATANASLYSMQHQQVTRLIQAAFSCISQLQSDATEITIVVIENEIVINSQPQEFSLFLNRFADILASRGVSHIKFLPGVTHEEITRLVAALSGSMNSADILSTEHIIPGKVSVNLVTGGNGTDAESGVSAPAALTLQEMPAEELAGFKELYEAVKQGKKIRISRMAQMVSGFIDAFRQESAALLLMASLRNADDYTFTHSTNVSILTIAQARSLGINGQLLHDIGIAAMFHDIGKLFIPEELIIKKDMLTPAEFEIMKQHPLLGAKHLLEMPGVPRLAVTTAYEHHLGYDQAGYPQVQSGWQLSLCTHMTMIADFFDALRTRRTYREPLELDQIAAMMLERAGTLLHSVLTRNFIKIIAHIKKRSDLAGKASPAPV